MGSRFRIYFYDADTREELADHPANGAEWLATGAFVHGHGKSSADDVVIRSKRTAAAIERGEASGTLDYKRGVEFGFAPGAIRLTAADFPGRRVRFKVWHPNGVYEWRTLA